jgi:hypothetical protein
MFRDCVVSLFIIIVIKKTVVKFFTCYDLLISFDDLPDAFEKKYIVSVTLVGLLFCTN